MAARSIDFDAQQTAAMFRRCGYPDATPAPEYCVDEIGPDGFYTRTVAIYVGEYKPQSIPRFLLSAMEKTKSRMGRA